ncbi:MAG TPA: c-type cytochrome domain-containing protein [Chthoniobacteraceae bacterium]|nr:c-type cytochrome domain-containing protein [Chthoniobacteraceae bacterium]
MLHAIALLGSFALASVALADAVPVSFRSDIAPVLHRRCTTCHGEENAKGAYRLDTFARLQKTGDSDLPPVVPGKSGESELYRLLIEHEPEDRMPQKADPLPPEEITLIKRWIDAGANYDGGSAERSLVELVRETMLRSAPAQYPRPAPITALAFSPDGKQIAASGYYEVTLWDVQTGALNRRIGGMPERINALAWHPQRNLLAVAGGSPSQWGSVLLVDPAAAAPARVLCDLPDSLQSVAFAPDGAQLAAAGGDRTIRFFDTASGRQTRSLRLHADVVQSVAYSRDGKRLVSASRDRTARVIDAQTGELLATYSDHEAPVLSAVFAPNGSSVLSVSRGQPVHVWKADEGKKSGEMKELGREPQVLLATTLGVITGAIDQTVRVHQLSDRQPLFALAGHRDCVDALALAPDGSSFASGGHDGEVLIWSLACGTWTQRFTASP